MKRGYWSSLLAHGTLLTLGCLFATDTLPIAPEPETPPVVFEPGENLAPGGSSAPGGTPGGAPATPTGKPAGGFVQIQRINPERVIQNWKEALEAPAPKPVAAPKTDRTPARPTAPAGHTSPRPASPRVGPPRTIPGATIPGDSPTGSGAPGIGASPSGSGAPGGTGAPGSGPASAWRERVIGAFAAVYIPHFREVGRDIDLARDEAEIRLTVSESGLVSLDGWVKRPASAVFQKIIEDSVARMPPVTPPVGGPATVAFAVSGIVE